jgi:thiosulfate dehydrogenase [quinone] large subunit
MARHNAPPPPKHAAPTSAGFTPPPRAHLLAGWALLPLRVFLGATFLFAGLQKLANPNFFDANSSTSIQAQLIASARTSPIHLLIGHLLQFATPLGVVIALGEVAVGIGMLLGLWTRIAALGGAALSFSLFLTVSFHTSPYYTGADIVFLFAFLPFLVSGAAGSPSLDRRIQRRASEELGHGDPTPYALPFVRIQDLCGSYDKGHCRAQRQAPCSSLGCPVLEEGWGSPAERAVPDQVDRRTVVIGAGAAAVAGVAGVVLAAGTAGMGRAIGGVPKASSSTGTLTAPSTTTTTAAPANGTTPTTASLGTAIGAASVVPVGGAATFTLPSGDPGIVLQPTKGAFLAYDAVCPHAGCTVSFSKAADLMVCPCHGSEFKVSDGAVIAGPSPHGLTEYKVAAGTDGQLYLRA